MKKLAFILISFFLAGNIALAQDIISANEAAKLLKDDNTVFLSARKAADFTKVHIPGAVNIYPSTLNGAKSMLKPTSTIAKTLGESGISSSKKIIVYDEGSAKFAGRMYWILKYMGAKDVVVLDGGMKAWRAARKPVTKNPTKIVAVTFTPKLNRSYIATLSQVKTAVNNPSYVLVDARSAAEFNGTAETKLRKGHIPSAINVDYRNVLTSKGTLKSKSDLTSLFNAKGITKNKKVILYCESSTRAGALFLALKGLGYTNVQVYDGAFIEWQGSTANKVVM